jgi:hypothetical protein
VHVADCQAQVLHIRLCEAVVLHRAHTKHKFVQCNESSICLRYACAPAGCDKVAECECSADQNVLPLHTVVRQCAAS